MMHRHKDANGFYISHPDPYSVAFVDAAALLQVTAHAKTH